MHLLALIIVGVAGAVAGYVFRAAIAKDLSRFQIDEIITHLETYGQQAKAAAQVEVASLIAELKKHL